jgi:hypothetical protein
MASGHIRKTKLILMVVFPFQSGNSKGLAPGNIFSGLFPEFFSVGGLLSLS